MTSLKDLVSILEKTFNKFDKYDNCKRSNNNIYYITEGTNAYIEARVDKIIDLGSHTMFIGEISDMEVLNDDPSLTYDYYFKHVKPKPIEKSQVKMRQYGAVQYVAMNTREKYFLKTSFVLFVSILRLIL